ncbi:hypothetical protein [Thalassotalea sp. Y01]|uniref:pyroglutamyl-peptidase I family protein n=1 Tax=Thalassotalea sp. Y01 TaxID=2729613 RepID=UPI0020070EAD|nr:hypothetical protein [Thalassotalea sp. Y01]
MRHFKKHLMLACSFCLSSLSYAQSPTYISYEEAKIAQAVKELPLVADKYQRQVARFSAELTSLKDASKVTSLVIEHASKLWYIARNDVQREQSFDGRSLYWGRLQLSKALKVSALFHQLTPVQQQQLLWQLELASRGNEDIDFQQNTDKKIVITGFDPFFLHRNIGQANPSGIAALSLDGMIIEHQGQTAEIQALMIPVRFTDFDQGMIETMLTQHFKNPDVDMIVTISMGREHFDLERFPGLRRSAVAPGNRGFYTGANSKAPLKPLLHDEPLQGPEFVEFSLPVKAMQQAQGAYQVIDNGKVETLEKGKFSAKTLAELAQQTSVNGSGGGYLSNEISYRSILLRDKYRRDFPVGHIHTPRISSYEQPQVKAIVEQIKAMLQYSISEI